jgi:hypothetical protein
MLIFFIGFTFRNITESICSNIYVKHLGVLIVYVYMYLEYM